MIDRRPGGTTAIDLSGSLRQAAGRLYTRPRFSTFSEVTSSPSFFFSAPAIAPRTVCALCRSRHKPHYADARIMPM